MVILIKVQLDITQEVQISNDIPFQGENKLIPEACVAESTHLATLKGA
jgi:hypothetical protein